MGEGLLQTNSNVNSLNLAKLSIGGGGTPDQLKSKVPPQSGQVFIFGGGGRVVVEGYSRSTQIQIPSIWPSFHFQGVFQTNSNPKFQVLTKFSFSGEGKGGEGVLQTNIPQILEWGHPRNFKPKILVNGMW